MASDLSSKKNSIMGFEIVVSVVLKETIRQQLQAQIEEQGSPFLLLSS
ncbi:hypothetical protein [Nonlabens spongiae]|nr:hypothetical protein [Nonlabens spongiae]